jgi:hypothetical protein
MAAAQKNDFTSKVVGAAVQGAVGAVVAATLSSVSEPLVNKVLVERIPLSDALAQLDSKKVLSFMKTTMATNFIKFPFFESTNVIMAGMDLPATVKGSATGAVFCTLTLPITNYRFRKSMGMEVDFGSLYQAYLPTVFRDILYGIVRNKVQPAMIARDPAFAGTDAGRFINTFVTIIAAAVLSAPGNELRGFCLQPAGKAKPFAEFFQPSKFVRSTSVGALIMAISLSIGSIVTPRAEKAWAAVKEILKNNPAGYAVIALLVFLFMRSQQSSVKDEQKK